MFEPDFDLSPDLEWMLQSGQASDHMLADTLVQAYYAPVYHLALCLLGNPETARKAAVGIFSSALLNTYRYRSEERVQTWLYRLALEVCQNTLRNRRARQILQDAFTLSGASPVPQAPPTTPTGQLEAALWSVVDELKDRIRLPALLHYVLGWDASEIARIMSIQPKSVEQAFKTVRRKYMAATRRLPPHEIDLEVEDLDEWMAHSLKNRWPQPEVYAADMEGVTEDVLKNAENTRVHRQHSARITEILLVGIAILLAGGLLWGTNRFMPETEPTEPPAAARIRTRSSRPTPSPATTIQVTIYSTGMPQYDFQYKTPTALPEGVFYTVQAGDTLYSIAARLNTSTEELRRLNRLPPSSALQPGQQLLIPGKLATSTPALATPVTPAATPEPLPQSVSLDDLYQRLNNFSVRLKTFWIDAQIDLFGLRGYNGPGQAYRLQLWFGQEQSLYLGGRAGKNPDEIILSNRGGQIYIARPGLHQPWFTDENIEEGSGMGSFNRLFFFFSSSLNYLPQDPGVESRIVGGDQILGRQTVIVEQTIPGDGLVTRLWLDELTGIPLLKRQYYLSAPEQTLSEFRINGIAFDIDFPQELFDTRLPWRGGYAQDYAGTPETSPPEAPALQQPWTPLTIIPAPERLDPTGLPLIFQYSETNDFFDTRELVATIFVGGFYLGHTMTPDPFTMICDRSPNGHLVAFAGPVLPPNLDRSNLHWIDLRDPGNLHELLPGLSISEFAFDPQSRRLAILATDDNYDVGLYIVNLDTGTVVSESQFLSAKSLAWSRGGLLVAVIALRGYENPQWELLVINAATGEIFSREPYEPASESKLARQWGIQFPVTMGGLGDCTLP